MMQPRKWRPLILTRFLAVDHLLIVFYDVVDCDNDSLECFNDGTDQRRFNDSLIGVSVEIRRPLADKLVISPMPIAVSRTINRGAANCTFGNAV